MKFKVLHVTLFFISILLPGMSLAQNKVVVIPLTETVETPLNPFALVAAETPPNSAYTDNGDGTVTDNVTGLVWQKGVDNTSRTWEEAWDHCVGIRGRLPSVDELVSIVDYDNWGSAINPIAFPDTDSSAHWSSTLYATKSELGWVVDFQDGDVDSSSKSSPLLVRCVRGLPNRQSLFKNNGDGTVIDLATGLTWQREDDNVTRTWDEANTYCNRLSLAGGDWRMPNIKELQSIVDYRILYPAIDADVFPGTPTSPSPYWSSSTYVNGSQLAWFVNFESGSYGYRSKNDNSYYVRCVR